MFRRTLTLTVFVVASLADTTIEAALFAVETFAYLAGMTAIAELAALKLQRR